MESSIAAYQEAVSLRAIADESSSALVHLYVCMFPTFASDDNHQPSQGKPEAT